MISIISKFEYITIEVSSTRRTDKFKLYSLIEFTPPPYFLAYVRLYIVYDVVIVELAFQIAFQRL